MARPDVAAANQRLQADPQFQAAWAKYKQTMAAAPRPSTTTQARNDDERPGGTGPQSPEQIAAGRELGATIGPLIQRYGLPGQPQAWHVNAAGQLGYEEDHSLRNIGIMMGSIVALGGISALAGGAAPVIPATQGISSATSLGLPVTAVAPTVGGAGGGGGIFGTVGTLATSNINPAYASAIPASAGGAVVPTVAPGLAPLSAGSMIPTAAGGGAGILGTAGTVAGGGAWDAAGNFIGDSTVNNLASDTPWWRTALDVAGEVGDRASDFEDARREQRQDESLAAYRQNLANEARFRSQLESRKLALDAPQKRADNSLRGDRLANTQDFRLSVPGIPDSDIQGGFRPSMWSENTRQLGRQMSADALAGSGTDELQGPEIERGPDPNGLDSFLNTASIMSTVARPYLRNRRR